MPGPTPSAAAASDELAVAAPPLIVIAGATATGKTPLSIGLAERIRAAGRSAEIISADSRQVYRGLDIGTAKVGPAERARVPHHGLDLVDPDESFTLADFVAHARAALDAIAARGGVALLVGGTGLYLRAVGRGLDLAALPSDPALRAALEVDLAEGGVEPLVARLGVAAPGLAASIDRRNPRRVVRALEIALLAGDVPRPAPRGYRGRSLWIGLRLEGSTHRQRIEARAREQFDAGLVEEAGRLRERFDPRLPAFSAIGYREAWAVLDGELEREAAIALDAARNVAFARRQGTWFRAEPGVAWLEAGRDPMDEACLLVEAFLAGSEGAERR
jgi:tRNA dimethylallyltransferase